LVGREAELKYLAEAWTDKSVNIVSLIAEGGAGKSALVNEWLTRLRLENDRGAEVVLGWSFYSQGTKERATSAEQFLNWSIERLGIKPGTRSVTAKGELVAEVIGKRRVLLLLDGCEPLQHGLDKQQGELKDQGLRALLRRLAATPPAQTHGLVVLTSRLPIKDIARWQGTSAPVEHVDKLSEEAGAALLRDNGVWGADKELRAASHNFGGHPLALGLLASYLRERHLGDLRQSGRVRELLRDEENPRHDHAKRVMESYEAEWLTDGRSERAIMSMIGLFDRPGSADCLWALRQRPVIEGFNELLVNLDEGEWHRGIARLREAKLLSPKDTSAPDALDAHPLVREWFGERFRQTNEVAWKAAHGRLYEHLRDATKEGAAPTLQDLAPLYQAVAHGSRAGRHEEALFEIYSKRICRQYYYSKNRLGAFGTDLAAIWWFFEEPYLVPQPSISSEGKLFLLDEAAASLRAQGRMAEALDVYRAELRMSEADEGWGRAAVLASNLSQIELSMGKFADAVISAQASERYADQENLHQRKIVALINQAEANYALGNRDEAKRLYESARQSGLTYGEKPNPVWDYFLVDLLLKDGEANVVFDRVRRSLSEYAEYHTLLSRSVGRLILCRADLWAIFRRTAGDKTIVKGVAPEIDALKSEFASVVDELCAAGHDHFVPYGFLARAAFRRAAGDWIGASRDLDEIEEIAERGAMKRYLCDTALERVRLVLARREGFVPLNQFVGGAITGQPRPDSGERDRLRDEAERQLAIAAGYIQTCGYHGLDDDSAELRTVLRGERQFSELPLRV
jgi:tetratricopeptide (TPR) repeat protein